MSFKVGDTVGAKYHKRALESFFNVDHTYFIAERVRNGDGGLVVRKTEKKMREHMDKVPIVWPDGKFYMRRAMLTERIR